MDSGGLSRQECLNQVLECLRQDLIASELYWSLFLTAAFHYKVDSLLRPFPSAFVRDSGEKDVDALRQICHGFPSLSEVLVSGGATLTDEQVTLIGWVFRSWGRWSLKSHDPCKKVAELRRLTGEALPARQPSCLFELVYGEAAQERFERLRSGRALLYAYHGSRAENFYSILRNGLQSNMNKTSLFGEGTYLTSELAVAMEFSPVVPACTGSSLGGDGGGSSGRLSVVALCELVDDPSVKCDRRQLGGREPATGVLAGHRRSSVRAPNSQAGDVPEKYYVATNNEMVRVKYLLVYTSASDMPSAVAGSCDVAGNVAETRSGSSTLAALWRRHRFTLTMLLYVLLLLCIGLLSSKRFWSHVRRLYQHAFDALTLLEWHATGDL